MAQGSKSAYTTKQKRQAKHIEASESKSGKSTKTAARIAYATINKEQGGGKKSGSGRKKPTVQKNAGAKKVARKKSAAKKSTSVLHSRVKSRVHNEHRANQ